MPLLGWFAPFYCLNLPTSRQALFRTSSGALRPGVAGERRLLRSAFGGCVLRTVGHSDAWVEVTLGSYCLAVIAFARRIANFLVAGIFAHAT